MEANPRDRWRRKRFKENLDRLLTERGLTRKAAADKAGVKEQWLRRAVSQGIAWPDKRSNERLKKLAEALGLDDVERLWGRDFYVSPERPSIKDEAARLGELMRKYVMRVGGQDATLRGIVKQIRSAYLNHRRDEARRTKAGDDQRPADAAGSEQAIPAGYFPSADLEEGAVRKTSQGTTADKQGRGGAFTGATPPSRDEEPESLRPPILLKGPGGEANRQGQANTVSKESSPLNSSSIGRTGPPSDSPSGRHQVREASDSDLARRILGEFNTHYLEDYRRIGLPRVERATLTADELVAHADHSGLDLRGEQAYHLAYLPWLINYAKQFGITWQIADKYIGAFTYLSNRKSGPVQPDASLETLTPDVLIARHHEEQSKDYDEQVALTRVAAKPLVARILDLLSPEEAQNFFQGYDSMAMAESYLEGELVDRMRGPRLADNEILPQQTPGQAVREIVAEIIEDYGKSKRHEDDSDSIYVPDEPIALEERSLESRHGDETPEEVVDHRGAPLPVGTALEAEIARSMAEDKEAAERHLDDILSPLSELAVPGGSITYLSYLKKLGNPRSVATVALRASDGSVGKALERLVEQVNKSIEDEKSRARPAKRPESARVDEKPPPLAKSSKEKRRSAKVRTEDIRESVLQSHKLGMAVDDIIVDLRSDEDVPERVRRAKKSVLYRKIVDIIARSESDKEQDLAPDEFDARSQDDKRNWEMGYYDEPDTR